jgi:hypothetical protein
MARKDWRSQNGVVNATTGAVTYSTVRVRKPAKLGPPIPSGVQTSTGGPVELGPPVKPPKVKPPHPIGWPPNDSGGQHAGRPGDEPHPTPAPGTPGQTVKIRRPKHPDASWKSRHTQRTTSNTTPRRNFSASY